MEKETLQYLDVESRSPKSDARNLANPVPETPSLTVPEPPPRTAPDGGFRAWLQVLGCFFLWFNLWGYTFAFGTFQDYYEQHLLKDVSSSTISWIGSIQSFLLIISGLWTGPIFDWGFYMYLIFAGALLSTLGAFLLSFCTKFWSIFLTQGLCIGFGCGLLFIPTMALVTRSFQRRRSIAVGVTTCGAPVGGILYTVLFQAVIPKVGFAWTARVLGFFMLGSYAIALPLLLWGATNTASLSSGRKRKLWDKSAFTDVGFWLYSISTFATFMGYLVPYFYMPTYAQTMLGANPHQASYALIASQAASVPGRLLAATAANYLGVMVPWTGCAMISGAICLGWIGVKSYAGFILFCAFYGAFSGPLVPLPPSIFPVVCPDPKMLGTRLGMAQAISSVANLLGPPIAGALLRARPSGRQHFIGVQLFVGILMLVGMTGIFFLWRFLVRRRGVKLWI